MPTLRGSEVVRITRGKTSPLEHPSSFVTTITAGFLSKGVFFKRCIPRKSFRNKRRYPLRGSHVCNSHCARGVEERRPHDQSCTFCCILNLYHCRSSPMASRSDEANSKSEVGCSWTRWSLAARCFSLSHRTNRLPLMSRRQDHAGCCRSQHLR